MAPTLFEALGRAPAYNTSDAAVQAPWQNTCQAGKVVESGSHGCQDWILENEAGEGRAGAAYLKAGGTLKERALKKGNKIPSNDNAPHLGEELATALSNNILLCLAAAQGGVGAFPEARGEAQEPAVMKISGLSANYNVPRPSEECIMAITLHGGAGAAYLRAGGTPQGPAEMEMTKMSAVCGLSHYDESVSAESAAPHLDDLDEGVTTVMFDIPCRLTQEQLIDSICDMGFADTYDFLYVPSVKNSNRGYAYVNFTSHEKAAAFAKVLPAYTFPNAKYSKKRFTVKAAYTQGKEANILRNMHSKVLPYIRDPPAFVLQSWARDDTVM